MDSISKFISHVFLIFLHFNTKQKMENVFCSLKKGFEKLAELLIQKGVDVHVVADNGHTSLINAADAGK